MKHIKWKYPELEDDFDVHLPGHDTERTLCGHAFEGAAMGSLYDENHKLQNFVTTSEPVNCDTCREIWKHCKKVTAADF